MLCGRYFDDFAHIKEVSCLVFSNADLFFPTDPRALCMDSPISWLISNASSAVKGDEFGNSGRISKSSWTCLGLDSETAPSSSSPKRATSLGTSKKWTVPVSEEAPSIR